VLIKVTIPSARTLTENQLDLLRQFENTFRKNDDEDSSSGNPSQDPAPESGSSGSKSFFQRIRDTIGCDSEPKSEKSDEESKTQKRKNASEQ
jgi:hypothetical protein